MDDAAAPSKALKIPSSGTSGTSATSKITTPLPVPTYGSNGVFTVIASIKISAPPRAVLRATLDWVNYSKWNSFVPGISVDYQPPPSEDPANALWRPDYLQPGTKFTMKVHMNGDGLLSAAETSASRDNPELMTVVEELSDGRKGFTIAWKETGFPDFLMRTERVHEFVETQDGKTEYTSWETFGGPLAYVVKALVGAKLVERFADWSNDLKRYVEGLQ